MMNTRKAADPAAVETVQQVDEPVKQARQAELGAAIPEATKPIPRASVSALAEATVTAIESLTNGEMQVEFTEVTEPTVDRIPDDLGSKVLALEAMIEKWGEQVPELRRYAFDAQQLLRDPRGVDELTATIDALGRDKKVIKAMQQPAETESAGAEGLETESGDEKGS